MTGLLKTTWLVAACLGLLASPARADALRDSLDASLAADDRQKLAAIMRDHRDPADQTEIAAWLKDKVNGGQAPDQFALSMLVISLRQKDKLGALTYLAYYRELILLDSRVCPDPSAGGSLLEGTIFMFGRLVGDPDLTIDQKQQAVDAALKLEDATSSVRKKDASLCHAGLSAYAKDLQLPSDPLPPMVGRYADDPVWRQHRTESLSNMKALLLSLGGVPTPTRPAR